MSVYTFRRRALRTNGRGGRFAILFVMALFGTGLLLLHGAACHRQEGTATRDTPPEPVPIPENTSPREVPVVGFGHGGVELDYEASFIGSARCGSCHVEHYESKSHMAMTSSRVTAENQDLWFSSERLAETLKWPKSDGRPPPRYRRGPGGVFLEARGEDGALHRARVAAVFGSGTRAFTPLSVEEGRGIRELRVSYFSGEKSWVMTPDSHDDPDPLGYVRSPESSHDCLKCHTTVLVFDENILNLEASVFGIGCERCHGPGSAHEASVLDGGDSLQIFNPGSLTSKDQVRFCGQCHRRPADSEPHRVLRRTPEVARHAGTGLMLSACFRRSPAASGITCLDCHSPHRSIDPARDSFNRPCLRCHGRPAEDHKSEPISESSDCTRCHMQTETKGFYGLKFTEHWIRVPDRPPPRATSERNEYAAYLEAGYRAAIARPGLGEERKSKLRMRLGKLLCGQGEREAGLAWLREALSFAPLYKDRILAAEYHRRAGRTGEAIEILTETVRLVPEHNRAYHTLAHIHLAADAFDLAEGVLRAWENARPDDPVLSETRDELQRRRRRSP